MPRHALRWKWQRSSCDYPSEASTGKGQQRKGPWSYTRLRYCRTAISRSADDHRAISVPLTLVKRGLSQLLADSPPRRSGHVGARTLQIPKLTVYGSIEVDVGHGVQLEVVRRGTGHVVLFIKESETLDVDAPVDVVPGVQADPVPVREVVPGSRDAGLP
jgi:hypothetical protein